MLKFVILVVTVSIIVIEATPGPQNTGGEGRWYVKGQKGENPKVTWYSGTTTKAPNENH